MRRVVGRLRLPEVRFLGNADKEKWPVSVDADCRGTSSKLTRIHNLKSGLHETWKGVFDEIISLSSGLLTI
jgi:hypothetical protein